MPEASLSTPARPNGAAAAPPPAGDETPLPPLSPDAEIKEQIARAVEVTEREERKAKKAADAKAKAVEKKAPKGKAKAVPAPTEEAPPTEPAPPPEETEEEVEVPGLTAPSAAMLVKARQLADAGDLDGAIKLAFGKDAAAFKLNSARWAEWRKTQDKATRAVAQREEQIRVAVRQLNAEYGPLKEARDLFKAEDYEGAFSKAFELDLNSFQKKALSKYHGKNPEVEAIRKELAAEREERARERREIEQQRAQQVEAQQHRANLEAVAQNLGQSDDPQLARLAQKPGFVKQVYREFLQRVNAGEPASMILVAACAEEIRDGISAEFGDVFVPRDLSASGSPHPGGKTPESPHQAGKKPARPGAAPAAPTSLSQRGASEASPPGRALTDEELFRKYTNAMKHAAE